MAIVVGDVAAGASPIPGHPGVEVQGRNGMAWGRTGPAKKRIEGARGARGRRRSVSPSGGFTSCGFMYSTWSMSWLA